MTAPISVWQVMGIGLVTVFLLLYLQGWRRLRRANLALATWPRLLAFSTGLLAVICALLWPLPSWSNYLLTMRSIQIVLISMVAAPLLWIGAPLHMLAWGSGGRARTSLVALLNPHTRLHRIVRATTQPIITWFLFVSLLLLWHDPWLAPVMLGDRPLHYIVPWVALWAALLFWWPLIDTAPRLHRRLPAWLFIVYLIGVEIANMVTGVTLAFTVEPVYAYYPAIRAQLGDAALPISQLHDQIAGGAIIWVFGSLVYISAIIATLYKLFRQEDVNAPSRLTNWDDHAKFIAPGLEHRVAENKLRNVDLSHR